MAKVLIIGIFLILKSKLYCIFKFVNSLLKKSKYFIFSTSQGLFWKAKGLFVKAPFFKFIIIIIIKN